MSFFWKKQPEKSRLQLFKENMEKEEGEEKKREEQNKYDMKHPKTSSSSKNLYKIDMVNGCVLFVPWTGRSHSHCFDFSGNNCIVVIPEE